MNLDDQISHKQILNKVIPFMFLLFFVGLMSFTFFFVAYLPIFLIFGPLIFACAWVSYGYLRMRKFHIPLKLILFVGYGAAFIITTSLILNQLSALNVVTGLLLLNKKIIPALWVTILTTVAIAPFVEEFSKALPNILFFWSKEKSNFGERKGLLHCEYRGLFFGIMIGTIFTILETYLYVFINLPDSGVKDAFVYWLQVVLRSGAPIHVGGGMLTGYGLGKMDRLRIQEPSRFKSLKTFFTYYLMAVALHFSWNGSTVFFGYFSPLNIVISDIISLSISIILGVLVYVIGYKFMKNSLNIVKDLSICERCDLRYPSELKSCPHCLKDMEALKTTSQNQTEMGFTEKKPRLTIPTRLLLILNTLLGIALVILGFFLLSLAGPAGSGIIVIASIILIVGVLSFAGVIGVILDTFFGWYISILFTITIAASVILICSFVVGHLILVDGLKFITGLALSIGIIVMLIILLILFFVFRKQEDVLTMHLSIV
ncbi:MAG: PrsW family glutamic-type intramembrane protease [Promethearchaeota archaeon]